MSCLYHGYSRRGCPFCEEDYQSKGWPYHIDENGLIKDGFKEEESLDPEFHAPKEDIQVNVDILKLPSYWQQFKNWWNS